MSIVINAILTSVIVAIVYVGFYRVVRQRFKSNHSFVSYLLVVFGSVFAANITSHVLIAVTPFSSLFGLIVGFVVMMIVWNKLDHVRAGWLFKKGLRDD